MTSIRSRWAWGPMSLALLGPSIAPPALGLDYPVSCRQGPGAVVTRLEGIDTPRAVMTGRHTLPDAIMHCSGDDADDRRPSALRRCVERLMLEEGRGEYRSEANCRAGLIYVSWPKGSTRKLYRLPIASHCAEENQTAIVLFRMLCPSYRGEIEEAQQ